MDILFINPPDEMDAMLGPGRELVPRCEPLGLLSIAAVARQAGHRVRVIDARAEGLDGAAVRSRVAWAPPQVVGVSVLTCGGGPALELGRWLKARLPGTLVVFGNVHASVYAEQYLAAGCCDAVVHGEGEFAFLRLAEAFREKRPFSDIPGVSCIGIDGKPWRTSPQDNVVEDLADLPPPARDLVDRRLYRFDAIGNQLYVPRDPAAVLTMSTSRGCGRRCSFCVVNQRPRFLPADRVVDEMEFLEKQLGAEYVLLTDPSCLADPWRMFAVCDGIKRRGLRLKWGCDARVDAVTPELVRAMAGANCHDLSLGVESGSQRLLDAAGKGITVSQSRQAAQTIRRHSRIRVGGLFILGLPGETPEDSRETIRLALSLPLDMAQFSLCTPYPGSELFAALRARGQIDDGIRPGGGLDPSVWRRYSAYISFTDQLPIWTTPGRDPRELLRLQKSAQRRFYLRPSQLLRHARRLRPGNIARAARILKGAFL